jgi:hypothetical protein
MTNQTRLLLAAAIVIGCLLAWWVAAQSSQSSALLRTPVASPQAEFSAAELGRFLAAAGTAEEMMAPMQRCLAFPDPPGSHWSHATVEAYCRYETQPVMPLAEIRGLIDRGHADEVDRRLADALLAQQTKPDSRGLVDRTFFQDFNSGSAEVRQSIDAWKRQSPRSAFAYAASGFAYVAAAGDARGSNWAGQTPASNFETMGRLLDLARTDLTAAAQLDPKLTPTYIAMLNAARLGSDSQRADLAAHEGLQADPSSYAIYGLMMEQAKPKWGGSVRAMEAVAADAKSHVAENPLIDLLLVEPSVEQSNVCGCRGSSPGIIPPFRAVLDQVAAAGTLSSAGNNADLVEKRGFAVVYLSEALRFKPDLQDDRILLIDELTVVGRAALVRDAAGPFEVALADKVVALGNADTSTLARMGQIYFTAKQWDKAWSISEGLTHTQPGEINGWILRAMIQKSQPRPGLRDTAEYIIQHFSNDPNAEAAVAQSRVELATDSPPPQAKGQE